MLIEALIDGEILTRYEVPDEYLASSEALSWKDNCESRQLIIRLYLDEFKKKMEKVFGETHRVDYYLVFTSKMQNDATDQISDYDPHGSSAPGDH